MYLSFSALGDEGDAFEAQRRKNESIFGGAKATKKTQKTKTELVFCVNEGTDALR